MEQDFINVKLITVIQIDKTEVAMWSTLWDPYKLDNYIQYASFISKIKTKVTRFHSLQDRHPEKPTV